MNKFKVFCVCVTLMTLSACFHRQSCVDLIQSIVGFKIEDVTESEFLRPVEYASVCVLSGKDEELRLLSDKLGATKHGAVRKNTIYRIGVQSKYGWPLAEGLEYFSFSKKTEHNELELVIVPSLGIIYAVAIYPDSAGDFH